MVEGYGLAAAVAAVGGGGGGGAQRRGSVSVLVVDHMLATIPWEPSEYTFVYRLRYVGCDRFFSGFGFSTAGGVLSSEVGLSGPGVV